MIIPFSNFSCSYFLGKIKDPFISGEITQKIKGRSSEEKMMDTTEPEDETMSAKVAQHRTMLEIVRLSEGLDDEAYERLLTTLKQKRTFRKMAKIAELRQKGIRKGSTVRFSGHYRQKKFVGTGVVNEISKDAIKVDAPSGTWIADLGSIELESGKGPSLEFVPTTVPQIKKKLTPKPTLNLAPKSTPKPANQLTALEAENKRRNELFLPPLPMEEVREVDGVLVTTKYLKEIDAESGTTIYGAKPSTTYTDIINLS